MLLGARQFFQTRKKVPLPYDAEVEYLESTGTQWIDTGVNVNNSTVSEVELLIFNTQVGQGYFGCNGGTNQRYQILDSIGVGGGYYNNQGGNNPWPKANTQTKIKLDGSGAVYLNDVQIFATTGAYSAVSFQVPIGLFCINFGSNILYGSCRIFRCKIWDNGTLVRDLIPVRKGNKGFMYDRISGTLFGNAGTGDFVLGPDVVYVDYIQSTGTQWIDTGVVATSETHINVRFSDYSVAGAWLFGARKGYQNSALGVYTTVGGLNVNRWFRARGSYIASFTYTTTGVGVVTFDYDKASFSATREADAYTVTGTDTTSEFSSSPYSIYLWSMNNGGSLPNISNAKIYGVKIWENGTPARDFVPVRVGTKATSWEGAMMDRLTRKIYRNAGTGSFNYA